MATHAGRALRRPGLARRRARRLRGSSARARGEGLLQHVEARRRAPARRAEFSSILVPMKLGAIGEEMVATAVKLAARARGATSRRCS